MNARREESVQQRRRRGLRRSARTRRLPECVQHGMCELDLI